jgi:tetratricopeptide (TPR) repeat protein
LTGEPIKLADALLQLGSIALSEWDREEGDRLLREYIVLDEQMGAWVHLSSAVNTLAVSLRMQGRFEEGLLLEEEWATKLGGLRSPAQELGALLNKAHVHLHQGFCDRASAEASQVLAVRSARRAQQATSRVSHVLGAAAIAREAYAEARRLLGEAKYIFRASPWQDHLEHTLALLAYADLGLADRAAAIEHLVEALTIASDLKYLAPHLFVLPAAALLSLYYGHVERAVEIYALACREPFVANSRWFEDVAGRRIAATAAMLSSDEVTAA